MKILFITYVMKLISYILLLFSTNVIKFSMVLLSITENLLYSGWRDEGVQQQKISSMRTKSKESNGKPQPTIAI
jgi:hypothetical protein